MGDIPNQNNYQTTQTYKIDINKIYSDFIQEIDAHRSLVNILTSQSNTNLNVFDVKTISGLAKLLKKEDTPQESRAHCFYRLIGFPVVTEDKASYYNPGFDNIIDSNKKIKKADKITIANKVGNSFRLISSLRENFTNVTRKIFSVQPATITSSAFALTSSTHTRPFSVPVKETDPFDFNPANQKYDVDLRGRVGNNDIVKLDEYVDSFGNRPGLRPDKAGDVSSLIPNRFHLIKPFIVDPRIDFSCNPATRKIAVPFVPNKSNLLVSENTFIKRPLLEKVIRERFTVQNQLTTISDADEELRDYILKVDGIKDEEIIQQMTSGDIYKLDDKFQFKKYLDMIQVMCSKLIEAQKKILAVQSEYYWLPIPSINGPEGGCSIIPVIISQNLPDGENYSFITDADRSIIGHQISVDSNQANVQTANNVGKPDLGNFVFGPFELTLTPDTTSAFGDLVNKELIYLNKQRDQQLKIANDALRTIEIIMGEFSGLGLCDIIAIMASLYLMPKEDLLGFLDDDAFARMKIALNLEHVDLDRTNIEIAQESFVKKVNDFYHLMDDIYKFQNEQGERT